MSYNIAIGLLCLLVLALGIVIGFFAGQTRPSAPADRFILGPAEPRQRPCKQA